MYVVATTKYVHILIDRECHYSYNVFIYTYVHVGSVFPFSNPSGILIFIEDSVQRINLTLINNDTFEVHMYIRMHTNIL